MPRRNLMAPAARRPASFRTPAVVQQLVHRPCQPVQRVSRHQNEKSITVCIRSEEHTSELQSLMRISYAVFCLKKKKKKKNSNQKNPNKVNYHKPIEKHKCQTIEY